MDFYVIALTGLLCILSFTIGAKIGQKVVKGEEIKIVKSPVKMVEEYKDNKERKKELEKEKIIAENIDNYDGTSIGQKDLPR